MSKPKKAADTTDRHKPRRMAAIRQHFIGPAEELMRRLGVNDLTELVNMALRKELEREGLWPPKSEK